jgi:ribosomal protein S18 acetylase RimI-like enzyme
MAAMDLLRPVEPGDLPELLSTAQALDTALWGRPETDHDDLAHELSVSGPLVATSRVLTSGRGIDGFVLVRGSECALTVHPSPTTTHRAAVANHLLTWARTAGAAEIDLASPDTELRDVASSLGWRHTHSSHELLRQRRVPPPALPDGVRLRPFRADLHARAVHHMLYAFWSETPTHHDRPYDQWRELFVDHPASRPDHQLVAWQDDEVVGAALGRIFTGDTGWILQLGVAPSVRRRGLGRALLCLAADRLRAAPGVTEVGLSVDATNDAALELYRAAGFEVDRTYLRFTVQPQAERSNG